MSEVPLQAPNPEPQTQTPNPSPLRPPVPLHYAQSLSFAPAPFTLHPTPHTLHPSPYTLHPTPYTLHPNIPCPLLSELVYVSHPGSNSGPDFQVKLLKTFKLFSFGSTAALNPNRCRCVEIDCWDGALNIPEGTTLSAVERIWRVYDSQGQILVLATFQKAAPASPSPKLLLFFFITLEARLE